MFAKRTVSSNHTQVKPKPKPRKPEQITADVVAIDVLPLSAFQLPGERQGERSLQVWAQRKKLALFLARFKEIYPGSEFVARRRESKLRTAERRLSELHQLGLFLRAGYTTRRGTRVRELNRQVLQALGTTRDIPAGTSAKNQTSQNQKDASTRGGPKNSWRSKDAAPGTSFQQDTATRGGRIKSLDSNQHYHRACSVRREVKPDDKSSFPNAGREANSTQNSKPFSIRTCSEITRRWFEKIILARATHEILDEAAYVNYSLHHTNFENDTRAELTERCRSYILARQKESALDVEHDALWVPFAELRAHIGEIVQRYDLGALVDSPMLEAILDTLSEEFDRKGDAFVIEKPHRCADCHAAFFNETYLAEHRIAERIAREESQPGITSAQRAKLVQLVRELFGYPIGRGMYDAGLGSREVELALLELGHTTLEELLKTETETFRARLTELKEGTIDDDGSRCFVDVRDTLKDLHRRRAAGQRFPLPANPNVTAGIASHRPSQGP